MLQMQIEKKFEYSKKQAKFFASELKNVWTFQEARESPIGF